MHSGYMDCVAPHIILLIQREHLAAHQHLHHRQTAPENRKMKYVSAFVIDFKIQIGFHATQIDEQRVVLLVDSVKKLKLNQVKGRC